MSLIKSFSTKIRYAFTVCTIFTAAVILCDGESFCEGYINYITMPAISSCMLLITALLTDITYYNPKTPENPCTYFKVTFIIYI
jgi:hypothetical protein